MNKYYCLKQEGTQVNINIYGDITSNPSNDSGVSSISLVKELEGISANLINVYINSYGGEVAEGLAIYNALKRHKAKIKTFCDGFACSIASVIFMAGDERIMSKASLLMIHNAWTVAMGNGDQLRKTADDLEIITRASINAYKEKINISEKELKEMLDNETWIEPAEALKKGFATSVAAYDNGQLPSQSVKSNVIECIRMSQRNRLGKDNGQAKKNITIGEFLIQYIAANK